MCLSEKYYTELADVFETISTRGTEVEALMLEPHHDSNLDRYPFSVDRALESITDHWSAGSVEEAWLAA